MTVEELVELEQRSMGRTVELVDSAELADGVLCVVVECEPMRVPGMAGLLIERRWILFSAGSRTSGVVRGEWVPEPEPTDGGGGV